MHDPLGHTARVCIGSHEALHDDVPVFVSNCTQAVRLPAEVRLPPNVKRVEVRVRGQERIISPVGHTGYSFFVDGPAVTNDFMAERASQEQAEREGL